MKFALFLMFTCIFMFSWVDTTETSTRSVSDPSISLIVNERPVSSRHKIWIDDDKALVPVQAFIWYLGGEVHVLDRAGAILIKRAEHKIYLPLERNYALVNQKVVQTKSQVKRIQGEIYVPIRMVCEHLDVPVEWNHEHRTIRIGSRSYPSSVSRAFQSKPKIVVIDPGHGGKDYGAYYQGHSEKDINLNISLKLEAILKSRGIVIFLTRQSDEFVSLYARSDLANKQNADLMISIHNNADVVKRSGSTILIHPEAKGTKQGISTKTIATQMLNKLSHDLGSHNLGLQVRPNIAVLRRSNVPTVLVEVGFMSNSEDLKLIKTKEYQEKAADSIAKTVCEIFQIPQVDFEQDLAERRDRNRITNLSLKD